MRKFHDTFQNSLGTLAVETPKKTPLGGKFWSSMPIRAKRSERRNVTVGFMLHLISQVLLSELTVVKIDLQ